jgi:hypothetical protein
MIRGPDLGSLNHRCLAKRNARRPLHLSKMTQG